MYVSADEEKMKQQYGFYKGDWHVVPTLIRSSLCFFNRAMISSRFLACGTKTQEADAWKKQAAMLDN